ncbi:hypothetical protein COY61_01020 [bacterium (Candidatus Gribaldobacteria) CG_4_10_14_0_8_um_filter_33_9]|uniref:AAA+ ATPase domain-containing protein n=1 Tax=bacterium (Candidatus Gribaldobacteria) CG_4_10_14_0_8_um_filter_33_9 TaxID=2014266 RepID=A0A2M7RNJ7_9BACT|nr:MAG: hypothetical protein COY61_01020 [bacterium (Candidatus Gribaldobacteria) CG_4_10_14_0_8_um_filter_33_9]
MLVRRDSKTAANDLNTVYRPCTTDEVLGNKTNMNIIKRGLDSTNLAHTFLFTGDAGCGKTSAARIIALGLNCMKYDTSSSNPCLKCISCLSILNHNSIDVMEINVGQSGGKDAVDNIVRDLPSSPFNARYKVAIFDEAHKLTSAAQDLLLKVIEDGYKHVYFIFCTNQPEKLTDTFITRCNVMHFSRISENLILSILKNVAEFEGMNYNLDVLKNIASESRGIPRQALVWLKQVNDDGNWTIDSSNSIIGALSDEFETNTVDITKALLEGKFKEAVVIYDKLKKEIQAERIRISIVAYIIGCLKRSKNFSEGKKFSDILDILSSPIFEQGKLGDYKLYNYFFKIVCITKNK